jgi:hypothetical protein
MLPGGHLLTPLLMVQQNTLKPPGWQLASGPQRPVTAA